MRSMKNDYLIAMVEDIQSKFDFVLEVIVPDIREMKADIRIMKKDIEELKADSRAHNLWLNDHERRIKVLEKTK